MDNPAAEPAGTADAEHEVEGPLCRSLCRSLRRRQTSRAGTGDLGGCSGPPTDLLLLFSGALMFIPAVSRGGKRR